MQCRVVITVLVFVFAASWARADEIHFKNGDRLTGKIVSLVEQVITFKAKNVGEVKIDQKQVATLSTDSSIEIHTKEGSIVHDAALASGAGGFRTAGSSEVGPQEFKIEDMLAINPPVEKDVTWSGEIKGGADFERGNTDSDETYAEVKAKRRSKADRIHFGLRYESERNRSQTRDAAGERNWDTTTREIKGRLRYDYFITKKLFWWAGSEAEKDGMKDLDLRFIGGGGFGYDWFDTKDLVLSTAAGVTWVSENYKETDNDADYIALLFQWNLEKLLLDQLKFFHEGNWLPGLGEGGERHVINAETGLRLNLTTALFVEGKVVWEWDTPPSAGTQRNDTDYILALGYQF
jgi:hypothetical protein